MGMMHSTSGKLGFQAARVPYPFGATPPLTRSQMKAVLMAEDALRSGAEYHSQVDQTGYNLQKLHAVTIEMQTEALRRALGPAEFARLAEAHSTATLLAQLKAHFGARPLNHSCAATAPAAQRQGRRVRIAPPAQDRPLGRGKGAGFGRHSGIGAHSQPWTTR